MSYKAYNHTRQKLPSPSVVTGKHWVFSGPQHVSGPRSSVLQCPDAGTHTVAVDVTGTLLSGGGARGLLSPFPSCLCRTENPTNTNEPSEWWLEAVFHTPAFSDRATCKLSKFGRQRACVHVDLSFDAEECMPNRCMQVLILGSGGAYDLSVPSSRVTVSVLVMNANSGEQSLFDSRTL